MRSRFSAYALGDWPYLWRTLHRSHVDRRGHGFSSWAEHVAAGSAALQFRKLLVIATAPVDHEGFAHVLFHADIREGKTSRSFAEHSRFAHDGDGWRYVDGVMLEDPHVPRPLASLSLQRFDEAALG